jgi:drug/metabolite transporter (DMT)-like permease
MKRSFLLAGRPMLAMRILAIVLAFAGIVCWLWPGAIGGFLFNALPVSARESVVIGGLFFIAAAILWFIPPSGGKKP